MPPSLKNFLPDWVPAVDYRLLDLFKDLSQEERERLRGPGQLTMNNYQEVTWQTLRAWQSFHFTNESGAADFNVLFPNAFKIWGGMKVHNLTTNETGEVQEHGKNQYGVWGGKVDISIARHHRLMFEDEDMVRFHHSDTRSESDAVDYDRNTPRDKNAGNFMPVVTWSIVAEEPASSGRPHTGERQQFTPVLLTSNSDIPAYTREVYAQDFDNTLQIDCWSNSEDEVTRLKSWFRRFQQEYLWYFELLGVQAYYFVKANNEEPVRRWRNDLAHRPMFYYVRTRELRSSLVRNIVDLQASISLSRDTTQEDYCPDPSGIMPITVNDQGLS